MTKARCPASFADAVTRVAGRLGWDGAAQAVGKAERTVRNWSDPDTGAQPSIDDALRLDAAYLAADGGEPPMLAVYQLRLERSVAPAADTAALTASAAQAAREAGEFTAAMMAAAQPGASRIDRQIAVREGLEAAAAITATVQKLGEAA
jgi:hypothetical protein